ncbi:MAG: beta-ketoacyl-ACP synthase II [Clostridiales bacterium]|nr:beta-ketoacyl-ACP synthase II [Clostridiales bacterium]
MNRVVVTGMGVISPLGNDVASFWQGLIEGKCGIGPLTRFDTGAYKVRIAAEVRDFDPTRHGLEVAEARRMDLYTQYAMAAAHQAMAQSGLEGTVAPERLGANISSGIGGIETFFRESEKLLSRGPSRVSPLCIPTMIGNMAAGNAAIRYKAGGSCVPVVTACATSTHSVGEAYRQIRHGYLDAVITGGSEAAVNPIAIAGFANAMALSEKNEPLASSLPFDRNRAGFVLGEGAAVLVLEEYGHARARGAEILGEIVGYGTTCDAYHITAPHPEGDGATRAIRMALEEAGDDGSESLYINAHGTGTPLNDKTETLAIKRALGEARARKAAVSSIKGATGHMLGAAGGAELIATLLALSTGVLPPTIPLLDPDPECDLDYVPRKARKDARRLGVSVSLGFGGHNGVLAVRSGI